MNEYVKQYYSLLLKFSDKMCQTSVIHFIFPSFTFAGKLLKFFDIQIL